MAYNGNFCTEAEIQNKYGAGSSSSITTDMRSNWALEAESYINVLCRYSFTDNYSSLSTDVKEILGEATSCLAAIYGINYDMSGYSSRIEAENMINVLMYRFRDCVALLKDQKSVGFIKKESGV